MTDTAPERIAFLVLPEFPLYALVPAIEALRLANQNAGARLYDWQILSGDGRPVTAGSGLVVSPHGGIADVGFVPMAFVCAGNHPLQHSGRRILAWLRRLDRHGATLGAIDTGAYILAEAGLLRHRTITLHWEAIGDFRARYPAVAVVEQVFVADRGRITCAGGHATLDMILHVVRQRHGDALAQIVAHGFVSPQLRAESEPQRSTPAPRADDAALVTRAIRIMERDLAAPLSLPALVTATGVSARTLHATFHAAVGEPPMRYYRRLRLQAARNALFYSDRPIHQIAAIHGFSCIEVFSRGFRQQFGLSPRAFRLRTSREQLHRFRPELERPIALSVGRDTSLVEG